MTLLAEATGISKSALGKYESDNGKDSSPFSIVQLADYYEVSADYLMGRTETKNHPNTALDELHLSDGAIDVLRDGKFNKRLLSEMICHPDFQRMMLDTEIYVDRIADMRINDMNTVLEAVQAHEKSDQSARKSDHDPRPGETKEAVNGNRMRRWGGLYIPLLPFPARRILFFKKSCICATSGATKSACPTAAEKRLSTSICKMSRCRRQPLPSVSREQRYNTLDFASKIVCQQGAAHPYWKPRAKGLRPSGHPIFLPYQDTQTTTVGLGVLQAKMRTEKFSCTASEYFQFSYMGNYENLQFPMCRSGE